MLVVLILHTYVTPGEEVLWDELPVFSGSSARYEWTLAPTPHSTNVTGHPRLLGIDWTDSIAHGNLVKLTSGV